MNRHLQNQWIRLAARIASALTAAILTLTSVIPAMAADTAKGSLTITPKVGDKVVETSYDGTFSLYLVATGVESGTFDLRSNFADYDGTQISKDNLEDETRYKEIAESLAAYVNQRATEGNAIEADLAGIKAFTEHTLDYGLYLVMQESAGSTYNACTPILVMIPAYSIDADGTHHRTTSVTAYPKLTKPTVPGKDEPHEPPTPPTHYGKAALGKSGAETGEPLQGVVFNLYKRDKNNESDEWVIIGTYTTDEKGVIYVDHVSYGEYYWEEARTLDGYVLDQTHQEFVINSEDLVTVLMTNQRIPETIPEEIGGFTGDESHMLLYGAAVVVAAAGLIVWIVRSRKEN